MKTITISSLAIALLTVSLPVLAETVVTVDNNKVTVNQNTPTVVTQQTVPQTVIIQQTPVIVTNGSGMPAFEGRVVEMNYSTSQIVIEDVNGTSRQVTIQPGMINTYRIGDTVQIRPTADVTVITLEENPRDFEGEIIRVDMSDSQIVVQDTNGRERRVQLKQGMIGTYKVDDYVRIRLMSDMKEAKTIETIRGVRRIDGNVVRIDYPRSQMVLRDTRGNETTVLVRQGMISNYSVGNRARVYLLADHEDVQMVRVIR